LTTAYLNRIATAVPPHDIHQRFNEFAPLLLSDERERAVFQRMLGKAQIDHRYSFLKPDRNGQEMDGEGFYLRDRFPDTNARMRFYKDHAFILARRALDELPIAVIKDDITHLIVTSCTGFYAPGLDLDIIEHYGLRPETERTLVGFMGCQAAINGLKLARHIVLSAPAAKVLMVNLELCTLHLQHTHNIEQLLSFLIFADGCATSIISSEPRGLALESFHSTVIPRSGDQITWDVGNSGFDMVLSGRVPATIVAIIPEVQQAILGGHAIADVRHWAVHPGGRSILDAVQKSLALPDGAMMPSRKILRDFGNMSSPTVMFVLKEILDASAAEGPGCAMAFGPGVTLESMLFRKMPQKED
jgi:alpha-pyrone synthase